MQLENSTRVKDAAFAREAIAAIAKGTPNLAARTRLAEITQTPLANYTPEGKALWAEYLAAGCPRQWPA